MSEPLEKRCENCRRIFRPHVRPNGKLEAPSQFKARRFCNRVCGAVFTEARKKVLRDAEARA